MLPPGMVLDIREQKIKEEKMKGFRTLSLVVVLTLLVSVGSLYAEETKASGYASVDVISNYLSIFLINLKGG